MLHQEGRQPAQPPLLSQRGRGASLRSQGTSAVDMRRPLLSLHYLYPSTFAFNTRPVALSLLTCLHANLDVRPWLCFSEICANLNLLHRQGRGHKATRGWQEAVAAAERPLLPSCWVSGTVQQDLPSTDCPLCKPRTLAPWGFGEITTVSLSCSQRRHV